jgi:hypothetical protein
VKIFYKEEKKGNRLLEKEIEDQFPIDLEILRQLIWGTQLIWVYASVYNAVYSARKWKGEISPRTQ